MITFVDPRTGERGVLRPLDPLAAAIEAASEEDVVLLTIALARAARDPENSGGRTP